MAKRTSAKPKAARRPARKKAAKRVAKPATAPKRGWSVAESVPALDLFDAMPTPSTSGATDDASLHDLFQQQTRAMLDRSDLDEEQKQSILVAMNCPCCGGSGLSFTMKLKRKR
jgi:hypothetical protein